MAVGTFRLCTFLWRDSKRPSGVFREVRRPTRATAVPPSGTKVRWARGTVAVAVILRPCELRALHELAKLKQAKLENLLLISFECAGVYPYATRLDGEGDRVEAYGKAAEAGELGNPSDYRDYLVKPPME